MAGRVAHKRACSRAARIASAEPATGPAHKRRLVRDGRSLARPCALSSMGGRKCTRRGLVWGAHTLCTAAHNAHRPTSKLVHSAPTRPPFVRQCVASTAHVPVQTAGLEQMMRPVRTGERPAQLGLDSGERPKLAHTPSGRHHSRFGS